MAFFSLAKPAYLGDTCPLKLLSVGDAEREHARVPRSAPAPPAPPFTLGGGQAPYRTAPSKLDRIRRGVPRTHSLKDPVPL